MRDPRSLGRTDLLLTLFLLTTSAVLPAHEWSYDMNLDNVRAASRAGDGRVGLVGNLSDGFGVFSSSSFYVFGPTGRVIGGTQLSAPIEECDPENDPECDAETPFQERISAISAVALDDGWMLGGSLEGAPLIVRLDSEGSLVWARRIDMVGATLLKLRRFSDSVLVIGTVAGETGADLLLIRVDSSGAVLRTSVHDFGGEDKPFDGVTSADGFVVAGHVLPSGPGSATIWMLKIDGNGDVIWSKGRPAQRPSQMVTVEEQDGAVRVASSNSSASTVEVIDVDTDGTLFQSQSFPAHIPLGFQNHVYLSIGDSLGGQTLIQLGDTASIAVASAVFATPLLELPNNELIYTRSQDFGLATLSRSAFPEASVCRTRVSTERFDGTILDLSLDPQNVVSSAGEGATSAVTLVASSLFIPSEAGCGIL